MTEPTPHLRCEDGDTLGKCKYCGLYYPEGDDEECPARLRQALSRLEAQHSDLCELVSAVTDAAVNGHPLPWFDVQEAQQLLLDCEAAQEPPTAVVVPPTRPGIARVLAAARLELMDIKGVVGVQFGLYVMTRTTPMAHPRAVCDKEYYLCRRFPHVDFDFHIRLVAEFAHADRVYVRQDDGTRKATVSRDTGAPTKNREGTWVDICSDTPAGERQMDVVEGMPSYLLQHIEDEDAPLPGPVEKVLGK